MSPQIEIQIIAIIVAVACSIPGVFLVLRKMAMMSDAITHTILLGIIIGFFIVGDLGSPILILGASLVGLLTVYMVEVLTKTKLVSKDSAIGVVFPFLFSIAIILITRYADSVHLDTDSVLLGVDFGAKAIYSMGTILLLNLGLAIVFFKEIKIAIFDEGLATVLGFAPLVIQYGLMASVSLTTVGAFEAVGSILVIAFMIGPPITAYLLTDDLKRMLYISAGVGAINAVIGYQVAAYFDVSIAGAMATITGLSFLIVFVFAPERGIITVMRRRKFQEVDFAKKSMLFHIMNHQGKNEEAIENGVSTIYNHLNWSNDFIKKIIFQLIDEGKIQREAKVYKLTEFGRAFTIQSYESIIESFNSETLT
jgi:manganese/zinc/iron transport system permease protein